MLNKKGECIMGHLSTFVVIDKKEDILGEAEDFAYIHTDRQENWNGNYHGNLTIHDRIICDNVEEAEKKIKALDNGWYDDHAVQFYDIPSVEDTKKMERLMERIAENHMKREAYEEKHLIQNLKSKLITCSHCGSKIAKDYMRSQYCPVCRDQDLRADYILKRLEKFEEDDKKIHAEYRRLRKELEDKQTEKYKGKAPIKWLAKFEIHI